jgi:hypothetical protein
MHGKQLEAIANSHMIVRCGGKNLRSALDGLAITGRTSYKDSGMTSVSASGI